ncbi:MAG: hypothetical protein AB8B83_07480 [Bdellovibrionales bacterium]
MNFSTIKKLAVTSAVALTLFMGAPADAQVTSQIGATFSTAAALASAPGLDMDFGTWAINRGGTDTFTIQLDGVTAGAPPVPTCAGVVDAGSLCVNTIAPANSGTVTVTTPTATTVQINGSVTTDFSDGTLSLASLTYTDTIVTDGAIPALTTPATLVTTVAAGIAETVGIGGTLTIATGTPAASSTFNDAVIDITFQF